MKRELTLRVVSGVILFAAVIFGWWYVAIPVGLLSLWFFPAYAELIIFAFIHDALYGMNGVASGSGSGGIWGYIYIVAATLVTLITAALKSVIKR